MTDEISWKIGTFIPSSAGDGDNLQPWPVPDDIEPGTYTIKVAGCIINSANSTFVYEG